MAAGQTHDRQIADTLLDHPGPRTIAPAEKAYDADRRAADRSRTRANIRPKRNRRRKPHFGKGLYRAT